VPGKERPLYLASAWGFVSQETGHGTETLIHEELERVAMSLPVRSTTWQPTSPTTGWRREDTWRTAGLLAAVLGLHVAGWGVFALLVLPRHLSAGGQVFGVGLAVTAYTLGLRHAFDADHIAAIDNTTRKLVADGQRPVSVGLWFALGHSAMVVVLAVVVMAGTRVAGTLVDDGSGLHRTLSLVGTVLSGGFLYLIGLVNLLALARIVRVVRRLRADRYDDDHLQQVLDGRGVVTRVVGLASRSITRPGQMFPVGMLLGLGFDTASEVTLLVLTGTGAAHGLPWYALLVLPVLFAAGMSLFDSLDGTFMNVAYAWAFAQPVRRVYYNLTVTGLSVTVALGIGTIELLGVAHDRLGLHDAVTTRVAALELDDVGYLVAAVFVVTWVAALAFWRLADVERRWSPPTPDGGQS
jgi:high-affinity nickel-transport protein